MIKRILLKTLLMLILLLALWQVLQPLPLLNRVSIYNTLIQGRERLPFGESAETAYNFTLDSADAMFASHRIHRLKSKDPNELRVVIIGDSSVWGTLLRPEETLAGQLDGRTLSDGRTLRCYNLGYPTLALSKDLLLLRRALRYKPDLIIWSMTLESFPTEKQAQNAFTRANAEEYRELAERLDLPLPEVPEIRRDFFAARRAIADWLRLQAYGILWNATGIDQDYTQAYDPPQSDLSDESNYYGNAPLAWDFFDAGLRLAENTPLLILNEPTFISSGKNSKTRYNFYYPREVYDQWRESLNDRARNAEIHLLDVWNLLPNDNFTNSAIHYDAEGALMIAEETIKSIEQMVRDGDLPTSER